MADFECPYCEREEEYCDDPIKPDEAIEWQCSDCSKTYLVRAIYSVDYRSEIAECLNDGNHVMEKSDNVYRLFNGVKSWRWRCKNKCGKEIYLPEGQEPRMSLTQAVSEVEAERQRDLDGSD